MANEATAIDLGLNYGNVKRYTVADSNAIEKGTLCKLLDPVTASGSHITPAPFAGIAAAEKVAADGSTTLGLYTEGDFDILTVTTAGAEGSITAGDHVVVSGQNTIRRLLDYGISGGNIVNVVGVALETATTGETIRVRLGK